MDWMRLAAQQDWIFDHEKVKIGFFLKVATNEEGLKRT